MHQLLELEIDRQVIHSQRKRLYFQLHKHRQSFYILPESLRVFFFVRVTTGKVKKKEKNVAKYKKSSGPSIESCETPHEIY